MVVTLLTHDRLNKIYLPEKISGQYFVTDFLNDVKVNLLEIEAAGDDWYIKSTEYAYVYDKRSGEIRNSVILQENQIYQGIINDGEKIQIITESNELNHKIYKKYKLVDNAELIIGRDNDCDIVICDERASSLHLKLTYQDGLWSALDLNSTNGSYVNGWRISDEHRLNTGDVVYIIGTQIIVAKDLIAINNPNECVVVNTNNLEEIIHGDYEQDDIDDFLYEDSYYYRSPRFKRDFLEKVISVDQPPSTYIREEMPLIMLIGPSLTMGIASATSASYSIVNAINNGNIYTAIPSMTMAISMLLGCILWPLLSKRYERKRNKRKEEERYNKYSAYLNKITNQIKTEKNIEQDIIEENNKNANYWKNVVLTKDSKLWERSLGQDDFLSVRLGIGEVESKLVFKYQERRFTMDDDDLQDKMLSICENVPKLYDVPVTVSFIENKIFGIVGSEDRRLNFLKNLLILLSSQNGYDELKFVFILNDEQEKKLFDVRRMPHVWDNEKQNRFIATNHEEVKKLSTLLDRKIKESPHGELADILDYFMIFVLDKYLAGKMGILKKVYKKEKNYNVSVISLCERYDELPKECSKFVELDGDYGRIYDRKDITGKRPNIVPDYYSQGDFDRFVTELAGVGLDLTNEIYNLPKLVTFLEMYDVGKIEHLNVLNRWKENNPVVSLETPIGINSVGDLFKLDLHEKMHGPHGLVAGMTGSGKSEFIMSFVLSMAVNYHPNEVSFVLIDYKGGGMAKAFEKLPHTAGIITNLDGAAVRRSLVSIQSELKRRQSIFSKVGTEISESNIDIYKYQKLYREGKVSEPVSHLFIVSDEFAELKTQQPEFMEQLISAARIGRSLGVHLILATQKPAGVVDDQIWSNSKFKICLKVQDRADSMDMLKKPDAASLVETGRFYLQVGYDELFEMGQSAWAGAPYIPSEKPIKQREDAVEILSRNGLTLASIKPEQKSVAKSEGKQLDSITNYLCSLAQMEKIKTRNLWLEPIPELIYVDDLEKKYGHEKIKYILNPIIGEYDDPARQRQALLTLPITNEGNAVIYGATGSGKTYFLNALIYSVIKHYSPEEVLFYVLDFGAGTLKVFDKGPHVAGVYTSGDEEKIEFMFSKLVSEVENRKRLFAEIGGDYLSYIEAGNSDICNIVVIINNYTGFEETYDQFEEQLQFLTREGTKYGIYFIVTAGSSSAIRYRMLQNFKRHFVLQMNDVGEYTSVLGSTGGLTPSKYVGRGLFRSNEIYEFQIAMLPGGNEFIKDYITSLIQKYGDNAVATGIPDCVTVDCFSCVSREMFPIGISKDDYKPIVIDLCKQPVWLVTGNEEEQIVHFLKGLIQVAETIDDMEINIIDGTELLKDMGKKGQIINSNMEDYIIEIFNLVLYRNNTYKKNNGILPEGEVYTPYFVVLYGFGDIRMNLSSDGLDKIKTVLDRIRVEYNVSFFVVDCVSEMSKYANEIWTKTQRCREHGIFIGNGVWEQFILKTDGDSRMLRRDLKNNYGFIINGTTVLSKLLEPRGGENRVE